MPQKWEDWLILDFSSDIYIYLYVNIQEKKTNLKTVGVPNCFVCNNRTVTLRAEIKYALQSSNDGERNAIKKRT